MSPLYDTTAPKKPANLSVNSDLLNRAKDLRINISSVLENALAEKLKEKLREKWLEENAESIDIYNRFLEQSGVFSDGIRDF